MSHQRPQRTCSLVLRNRVCTRFHCVKKNEEKKIKHFWSRGELPERFIITFIIIINRIKTDRSTCTDCTYVYYNVRFAVCTILSDILCYPIGRTIKWKKRSVVLLLSPQKHNNIIWSRETSNINIIISNRKYFIIVPTMSRRVKNVWSL
jgi:hypothetical protein